MKSRRRQKRKKTCDRVLVDKYGQEYRLVEKRLSGQRTLVWTAGLSDWIAAGQGSLAKEFENIVPFAPLSEISDKWIWALAVLPLALISPAAEYIARLNGLDSWIPIVCTVVANIFFLYKDRKIAVGCVL